MSTGTSLTIVLAWQEAVNSQDVERLLELSDPNIEIVGPRGSGYGHPLLREWMERARLHLETLRTFERDDTVVLAQHAVWRSPENGEIIGTRNVASRFRLTEKRVMQYARYDELDVALAEAGLDYGDELPSNK